MFVISPASGHDTPARVLGPISATCVVIGAIVGVGIFISPSEVAQTTGRESLVLAAWALGGLLAVFGALVFAELGGMFTGDGAQYSLLRDAYGPLPGFLFVFCITTILQPGTIAVIAVTCVRYLLIALEQPDPELWWLLTLASLLIVLLTAANIVGVKAGAGIQNLTVVAKVAALVAIVLLAMFATPAQQSFANAPTTDLDLALEVGGNKLSPGVALLAALVPVLFAFGGWQQVMWIAGEVRDPQRNLPRAILAGVAVVIVIYLAANWAYLHLLGFDNLRTSEAVASDAVARIYPTFGARLAAAAVAISAFGVLNANVLTGPRLVYGLARDGRFFSIFARISPRFGTPAASIALISALSLVLLISTRENVINTLVGAVVLVDVVFFVLTVSALFIFRRTKRDAFRAIKCPGYPVVPILFILGELGALVAAFFAMYDIAIIAVGWLVTGVIVYFLFFREHTVSPRTE